MTDATDHEVPPGTNDVPEGPLLLGPLLRYADETSATIWVETDRGGTLTAAGHGIPVTHSQTFSVGGRHFGLIMVEGLEPNSTFEYELRFDNAQVWPEADSLLPPSVIRTTSPERPASVLVGSCRAAAPHELPFTLERAFDHEGRGVDTLWAHARRMVREPIESWPDLLLLVGDQIYADDSSPQAKERIEACRDADVDLPAEIVASFEEYCWLYEEAWSSPLERWMLSTVPSAMIFDDHDMIDDWNISDSWVRDIRTEPWWAEHAVGGLMSYWIYQHLGNLSPTRIRDEGLLDTLLELDDATDVLRAWALSADSTTPLPGGYRFSYVRTVGDVTVVVIDSRNSRVLDGAVRLMVGPDEWRWICEQAESASGHLLLASSVPVFIADGLHDLQVWNERVCGGAWGRHAVRFGERIRRGLDLEDWSAFAASYDRFVELLARLQGSDSPPASIVVASGDIHFSYAASVALDAPAGAPTVWQVVSSPTRNALIPPERSIMRFTLTPVGRWLADLLRRTSRAPRTRPGIEMAAGPYFANNMCELKYADGAVGLTIEQSTVDDDQEPELRELVNIQLSNEPAHDDSRAGSPIRLGRLSRLVRRLVDPLSVFGRTPKS